MKMFRRLFASEPQLSSPVLDLPTIRPLQRIAAPKGLASEIQSAPATAAYADALAYFADYPPRSLMSDHSRTILYTLARTARPRLVAEIGTLYAGTTEVLTRALWENGEGLVHSADPYGGERCPPIIAAWPAELQRHVKFHAKSSMDFFSRMVLEKAVFDLVLIDGSHDYEYALFDLQMTARLLRPGGIVIMDNAEQMGPFKAARSFLADNPAWRELGSAISDYTPSKPFDHSRASIPGTSFLILHAPTHLSIGPGPQSWGQAWIDLPSVKGLRLEVVEPCSGTLFYQIYLRGFADGNRWTKEERLDGALRIEPASGASLHHDLSRPMAIASPAEYDDTLFTVEFDLSWQADPGSPALALAALPTVVA